MPVLIARFPVLFHQFPYPGLTRALVKRQPPIDLPGGVHVAFAVFVNLGELAGAVVGIDLWQEIEDTEKAESRKNSGLPLFPF